MDPAVRRFAPMPANKVAGLASKVCANYDGPSRDRTYDLGIKSPLLYQLSYRPRGRESTSEGASGGAAGSERAVGIVREVHQPRNPDALERVAHPRVCAAQREPAAAQARVARRAHEQAHGALVHAAGRRELDHDVMGLAHRVARQRLGQVGHQSVVERLADAHERRAVGRRLDVDHCVVTDGVAVLSCFRIVFTCGALTSSGASLRKAS